MIKLLDPKNYDVLVAIIGFLGIVTGVILTSFVDSINANKEFKRNIRLERVNDLMDHFPILIEKTKIQIQDLQYSFNVEYWEKILIKEDLDIRRKLNTERSEYIIELKERCTIDTVIFKKSKRLTKYLDKIVELLDKDLPKYFKNNKTLTSNDHNYLEDLNGIRKDFMKELEKKLKIGK